MGTVSSFVQVRINFYKQLIKMHIKSVSCVVALLFAVANARYTGVGPAGACTTQCSPDHFMMNMYQCNRQRNSGCPFQNPGQCSASVDRWIQCMQMNYQKCMSSSCPSVFGQRMQPYMPIVNRFMSVSSLNGIYQAIDGTISDIINQWGVQLPPHLEQIRRNGVANLMIPLEGHEGLTISQYVQQTICPVPGQQPIAFQRLLPRIQSLWQMLSAYGAADTSAYVPFCDGDFTSYIVNNVLDLLQAFYSSTSRGQYCSMQSAAANFIDTVLNKKCNFDQIFSQVGIPSSITSMLKNAGQAMYQQTGCAASNMFQGMDWSNMFRGMNWNNMNWNNMFQGMDWNNMFQGMDWNNLFQGMWNNQGYSINQGYS